MNDETLKAIRIAATTCHVCKITPKEMEGSSQVVRISIPRLIAMGLIRELTLLSMQDIADLFKKRHHTSSLYAIRRMPELRKTNPAIFEKIENRLSQNNQEHLSR